MAPSRTAPIRVCPRPSRPLTPHGDDPISQTRTLRLRPPSLLPHPRLTRRGEEWDRRTPRAATICDDAAVQTFKAPSEEQPGGLAVLGGKLFVAQGAKLHQVDLLTGNIYQRDFNGFFEDLGGMCPLPPEERTAPLDTPLARGA